MVNQRCLGKVFFLKPLTKRVTASFVTECLPPVTVRLYFPIAPAPVPVGLAPAPAPLPTAVVTPAPALVAPDTADVEVEEPQPQGRPDFSTQYVQFTDCDILQPDELPTSIPSEDSSDNSTDTTYEKSV